MKHNGTLLQNTSLLAGVSRPRERMEVEHCLPTDDVLLKETKKFLAYQELYSWQENMRLYECNADYLKVRKAKKIA